MPYSFPAFSYDSVMLYGDALKSGARPARKSGTSTVL
jgi:hypothetical protein